MNEHQLRNQFRGDLSTLIEDMTQSLENEDLDPYSKESKKTLLEHHTRILFFDRLLTILGWRLGAKGNVAEEARIKAETTRFMDYLGLKEETKAPLMIFEAKAWDKPFVSARNPETRATDDDLIAAAIRHILNDKPEDESPVTKQWHDYLKQIMGYVCTMKKEYEHNTPCAVLSSGQWTVVFTNPVLTFVDGRVSTSDIKVFKLETYKSDVDALFNLLHCSVLAQEIPFPLRPTQIKEYVDINSLNSAFYGLHVHYEETGSRLFRVKPQVLIYPVLILQRHDGVLAVVANKGEHYTLEYTQNSATGAGDLTTHLDSITACFQELHTTCEEELGRRLTVSSVEDFPGFPSASSTTNKFPLMVKNIKNYHTEWLVVTGTENHYLRNTPLIDSCRFHSWAECHSEDCAIGISAISIRSTDPKVIFTDKEIHHCAHQVVYDRRNRKCHILQIDERVCCQTCHYLNLCWSPTEQEKLPCGK